METGTVVRISFTSTSCVRKHSKRVHPVRTNSDNQEPPSKGARTYTDQRSPKQASPTDSVMEDVQVIREPKPRENTEPPKSELTKSAKQPQKSTKSNAVTDTLSIQNEFTDELIAAAIHTVRKELQYHNNKPEAIVEEFQRLFTHIKSPRRPEHARLLFDTIEDMGLVSMEEMIYREVEASRSTSDIFETKVEAGDQDHLIKWPPMSYHVKSTCDSFVKKLENKEIHRNVLDSCIFQAYQPFIAAIPEKVGSIHLDYYDVKAIVGDQRSPYSPEEIKARLGELSWPFTLLLVATGALRHVIGDFNVVKYCWELLRLTKQRFWFTHRGPDTLVGWIDFSLDLVLGRTVARKVSSMELEKGKSKSGASIKEDTETEALLLTHLTRTPHRSPYLVYLYDNYTYRDNAGKKRSSILEYAPEGDLMNHVYNRKKTQTSAQLDAENRIIFRQLMEGLRFMHENQVAHQDLSPENVLLSSKLSVRLCDLGVALPGPGFPIKEYAPPSWNSDSDRGKLFYKCPEKFNGLLHDLRSADLYSCGIILFYLLTSNLPYSGHPSTWIPESDATWQKIIEQDNLNLVLEELGIYDKIPRDARVLLNGLVTKEEKRLTLEEVFQNPYVKNTTFIPEERIFNCLDFLPELFSTDRYIADRVGAKADDLFSMVTDFVSELRKTNCRDIRKFVNDIAAQFPPKKNTCKSRYVYVQRLVKAVYGDSMNLDCIVRLGVIRNPDNFEFQKIQKHFPFKLEFLKDAWNFMKRWAADRPQEQDHFFSEAFRRSFGIKNLPTAKRILESIVFPDYEVLIRHGLRKCRRNRGTSQKRP